MFLTWLYTRLNGFDFYLYELSAGINYKIVNMTLG